MNVESPVASAREQAMRGECLGASCRFLVMLPALWRRMSLSLTTCCADLGGGQPADTEFSASSQFPPPILTRHLSKTQATEQQVNVGHTQ
jgi:hypothetical protein